MSNFLEKKYLHDFFSELFNQQWRWLTTNIHQEFSVLSFSLSIKQLKSKSPKLCKPVMSTFRYTSSDATYIHKHLTAVIMIINKSFPLFLVCFMIKIICKSKYNKRWELSVGINEESRFTIIYQELQFNYNVPLYWFIVAFQSDHLTKITLAFLEGTVP